MALQWCFQRSIPNYYFDFTLIANDLDEAKLTVFQGIDAPISPGSKGLTFFKTGITPEMQQTRWALCDRLGLDVFRRERLLDATVSDLVEVARKYLSREKLEVCNCSMKHFHFE